MTYPIIEDGNVFYFETDTQNKVSVEFTDLTHVFEFDKYDCALVAFIDTSTDKKGKARNRLFKSWFNLYGQKDFLIEPREIIINESESYSLLIFRKSYGNAALIIDAFDNFIKLANELDS